MMRSVSSRTLRRLPLLLLVLMFTACATRFENVPLAPGANNEERRTFDTTDRDKPVVLIALSGGGARAAALGWTVLQELKNTHYPYRGQSRRLIDDVAVVSSVSGGSVIAAYYGLYGPEGLDGFEPEFLTEDNVAPLLSEILNPFAWLDRLASGTQRSDTVEKMFDEKLFRRATFADLNQPGKPVIIVNATDLGSGEVFAMTPDLFDTICSDLDKFPLSSGVAASSAVPVVLSPIALENFASSGCADRQAPAWVAATLEDRFAPYNDHEKYKRARYLNDLRRGAGRFRDIRYVYLVDGGLADNIGVHGILDTLSPEDGLTEVRERLERGEIKKLVVVVVNARADAPNGVSASPEMPGIAEMAKSVASTPIDSATAGLNARLNDLLAEIREASRQAPPNAGLNGLKIYNVSVNLDQLRGDDETERRLRDQAKHIPTSWDITAEDKDTLKATGPLLLRKHPCFQRLLMDLKASAPFIEPDYAVKGCAW